MNGSFTGGKNIKTRIWRAPRLRASRGDRRRRSRSSQELRATAGRVWFSKFEFFTVLIRRGTPFGDSRRLWRSSTSTASAFITTRGMGASAPIIEIGFVFQGIQVKTRICKKNLIPVSCSHGSGTGWPAAGPGTLHRVFCNRGSVPARLYKRQAARLAFLHRS